MVWKKEVTKRLFNKDSGQAIAEKSWLQNICCQNDKQVGENEQSYSNTTLLLYDQWTFALVDVRAVVVLLLVFTIKQCKF